MIQVLVVEDESLVAEAHRELVDRMPGFRVVDVANNGGEAMRCLSEHDIDLVLLDFYLPDTTGLAVCQALRRAGSSVDVMAVTSARDVEMVRAAVSLGVVLYLVKPFTSAALREKLETYATYHASANRSGRLSQQDVDSMLATLRAPSRNALPKGLTGFTLQRVIDVLRSAAHEGRTSTQVAEEVGIARVTARRYLQHLDAVGLAALEQVYGVPGRPEHRYLWIDPLTGTTDNTDRSTG